MGLIKGQIDLASTAALLTAGSCVLICDGIKLAIFFKSLCALVISLDLSRGINWNRSYGFEVESVRPYVAESQICILSGHIHQVTFKSRNSDRNCEYFCASAQPRYCYRTPVVESM